MEYAVLTQFYQYETKRISTNSSVYFKTSSNAANKVYSVLLFCLCNVCLIVCLFFCGRVKPVYEQIEEVLVLCQ